MKWELAELLREFARDTRRKQELKETRRLIKLLIWFSRSFEGDLAVAVTPLFQRIEKWRIENGRDPKTGRKSDRYKNQPVRTDNQQADSLQESLVERQRIAHQQIVARARLARCVMCNRHLAIAFGSFDWIHKLFQDVDGALFMPYTFNRYGHYVEVCSIKCRTDFHEKEKALWKLKAKEILKTNRLTRLIPMVKKALREVDLDALKSLKKEFAQEATLQK